MGYPPSWIRPCRRQPFNPYNAELFLCEPYADKNVFFFIQNHPKCVSQLFLLHLNTYVMGLNGYYEYFNSTGIDFRSENLASKDGPRTGRIER